MQNITFLIHLYYPGSWEKINMKCGHVIREASRIIITACHDDVIAEVESNDRITILKVTNKGKDIGGKLVALSYYLFFCQRTAYIAFLHDKISPQTINAEYWFDKLYSIFEKGAFENALRYLDKNARTGIIGSKAFIKNEYIRSKKQFDTTNNNLLQKLISEYHLNAKKFDFVAGTIFIGRSRIFEDFFTIHSPLKAREKLEMGNVLDLSEGTFTHAWERFLCFIAESLGYAVKGI
ncbi:MAG: rhamnan synthesis F family protein [Bacteroidota bacterium]